MNGKMEEHPYLQIALLYTHWKKLTKRGTLQHMAFLSTLSIQQPICWKEKTDVLC